jgi:hypothetical protein
MEGYCSTGQSPQRAVVPMEERRKNDGPHNSPGVCGRNMLLLYDWHIKSGAFRIACLCTRYKYSHSHYLNS